MFSSRESRTDMVRFLDFISLSFSYFRSLQELKFGHSPIHKHTSGTGTFTSVPTKSRKIPRSKLAVQLPFVEATTRRVNQPLLP